MPSLADTATPDPLLGWMNSLADPTRLRVLSLLEGQELGVAELCEVLQLPQSTVSRHLKVLAERSWVHARAQGTANLYRMHVEELVDTAAGLWQLARAQTDGWAALAHDRLRLQEILGRRRNGSFFARTAERWEHLRHELYGSSFLLTALAALLPADLTLIDLGCGTGELVTLLAPRARRVYGVDSSQEMLATAAGRLAQLPEGGDNARLLRADLGAVPLPAKTADAVLLLLALTYVEEPAAVIRELARLLTPGGKGIVVTLLRHDREDFRREMHQVWPGFEAQELAAMLRGADLQLLDCRPLAPEPRAKGPALLLATVRKATT